MGCMCSKESDPEDYATDANKEKELNKVSPHSDPSSKKKKKKDDSDSVRTKPVVPATMGPTGTNPNDESDKNRIVERPTSHSRRASSDMVRERHTCMNRIISMPHGTKGEQVVAGWPTWLTSVAGEAIQGWLPRSADSFERLNKIGQGTYSSVYKARDLQTKKLVAMKKVRFVNMDPESVRFMAREIHILRKLDHPNVMKLEGIVTSRVSSSLYLVFDYMEHDLSGLAASPDIKKFTEPQIKCYTKQLLSGLEYCHSRGVLHRDIKGSNLLVDNNGILKIGDFGLATFFQPEQNQPLTSRVVTLWYRAPELLLGSTDYGVAIDLWSVGCIIAELFVGKPIMPGRTEVEQMHKIFKLCGSPSEEYWKKTKLPHATSFKPQQPYKRRISETFKDFPSSALSLVDVLLAVEPQRRGTATSALNSNFFTTKPLPCEPSNLPKFPPSKEFDAKLRDEEARRKKAEAVKGRGPESVRRGPREGREEGGTNISIREVAGMGSAFPVVLAKGHGKNGISHSASMVHPTAEKYSWSKKTEEGPIEGQGKAFRSSANKSDLRRQTSNMAGGSLSNAYYRKDEGGKESNGYNPNKTRIHCSGPLMPPGANLDDMLKEHERQIQEAVRKARLDKQRSKNMN